MDFLNWTNEIHPCGQNGKILAE